MGNAKEQEAITTLEGLEEIQSVNENTGGKNIDGWEENADIANQDKCEAPCSAGLNNFGINVGTEIVASKIRELSTIAYLYGLDEDASCGGRCENDMCRCLDEEEMALLRLAYNKDRLMTLQIGRGELKIYENNVVSESFRCEIAKSLPEKFTLVPTNVSRFEEIEIEPRVGIKSIRSLLRIIPAVRAINNIYQIKERKLLAYAWLMEDGVVDNTFRRFEMALIVLVINTFVNNHKMTELSLAIEKLFKELNSVFFPSIMVESNESVEAHPTQFPGYDEYLKIQIDFLDNYQSAMENREKELSNTFLQAVTEEFRICEDMLIKRKKKAGKNGNYITYSYLFENEDNDVCMLYCVLREVQEVAEIPEGPQEKRFYKKSGCVKRLKYTLKNPNEPYAIVINELREAKSYTRGRRSRVLQALRLCFQDTIGLSNEKAERFREEAKRI